MSKLEAYMQFLKDKVQLETGRSGMEAGTFHPSLFPHQRDIVAWALKRSKGLIAAKFGMGKSRIQIAYLITNYERVRDGQLSAEFLQSEIAGVCLDEGAILGNLGTKTQDQFNRILGDISYRWVATATPAPNDYRQLIYFADFLDAMDAGQSLTRWFGRNPDKAGDLQLLPHMEKDFWLWIASWAIFVDTPSDLGYSDDGYVMPELDIRFHRLTADHQKAWDLTNRDGQHFLFKDTSAGVTQAMREKRDSLAARVAKAAELVAASPDSNFVIWHDLEDERRAIDDAIGGVTPCTIRQ